MRKNSFSTLSFFTRFWKVKGALSSRRKGREEVKARSMSFSVLVWRTQKILPCPFTGNMSPVPRLSLHFCTHSYSFTMASALIWARGEHLWGRHTKYSAEVRIIWTIDKWVKDTEPGDCLWNNPTKRILPTGHTSSGLSLIFNLVEMKFLFLELAKKTK